MSKILKTLLYKLVNVIYSYIIKSRYVRVTTTFTMRGLERKRNSHKDERKVYKGLSREAPQERCFLRCFIGKCVAFPIKQKSAPRDAHSREEEICRKRPRSARECAKAHSFLPYRNVKETDLLIAATSADEINLLCCMTAHGMNRNLHTIARIRNPEYTDQIFEMRNLFALSMTVNPEKQAAVEIERLLKFPGFRKRDTFAKGRVEIVEVRIDANSHLRNLALNEIYRIVGVQVLVCTILRSGKAIVPDGNFIIREGDRLFVTASTNNLASLLKNLGILSHKVKHVMLCGGGRVSYYLAERLQKSGMQVQIIEQNMILSMYANSSGVPMVVTKVGHVDNTAIMDSLQLGSIVSPKELCSNSIVRYVRAMRNQTGAARAVHTFWWKRYS